MGERPNNRRAFENVVGRMMAHEKKRGREPSEREVRRQVGELARTRDHQRDVGADKNRSRR